MRFRSLQSRILIFFLVLFTLVQGVTIVSIVTANWRWVNTQIRADLDVAGRVFERLLDERVEQLVLSTKLLSGDFAFKQAYASGDRETLMSAVRNLQEHRIGADVMILADAATYTVIADTLHPDAHGKAAPFRRLIERSENTGKPSASLGTIDEHLYEIVVIPLLAPEPVAWIAVGFRIDDGLAGELKDLAQADVSFLARGDTGARRVVASTLPAASRHALASRTDILTPGVATISLGGEDFVASRMGLDGHASVIIQRSLDEALAPFQRLYRVLLIVGLASVALTVLGSVLIARTVTRPVKILAEGAHRIGRGDYAHPIHVSQRDEIGQLADAFNQMTNGLRAFQRYLPGDLVRTLISKGIESRPQARVATVLFTDIADFTDIVDGMSPERIVTVLNHYFSAISRPIQAHGGVILQFQGDAVLAVFNLPEHDPEHAIHAVRAALEIQDTVAARNFGDAIRLRTRIGINTGEVVAGSVGSESRVAYTVHGDAVNLAARLESLNKAYGTRILVSAATAELLRGEFAPEALGEVEVRGRHDAVSVYKLA